MPKRKRLFAIQAYGTYGGGWALVFAVDEARARKIASTIKDSIWFTRYDDPSEVVELALDGEGLLYHYETGE